MKKTYKKQLLFVVGVLFSFSVWAVDRYVSQGLDAYSKGDFSSAVICFQKSLDASGGKNEEAQYWLTMALASGKNYSEALSEAKRFLALYPHSLKTPDMIYQKGRIDCALGHYETAISTLYDFIERYPNDKALASAYFWIGESLYNTGRFDEARTIFSVIVLDYPESAKAEPAKYKLALIDQAATQNELLRLLKLSNDETIRLSKELEALKARDNAHENIPNNSDTEESKRIKELETYLVEERKKNAELYDKLTILQMKNDELSTMIANFAHETYRDENKPSDIQVPVKPEPSTEISEPVPTPPETKTPEVTEAELKRRAMLDELLRKAGLLQDMYDEVLEDSKNTNK